VGTALTAPRALAGQHDSAREHDPARQTLTLDEVIARALELDPATVAALGDVDLAAADRLQIRGSLLPTLSSNLVYANSSNERFDQTTGRLVSESYTAQIQTSYELFGGGRRLAQLRAAGADVGAADAALRAQRFQTILAATQAYYATAAAADLLGAAGARLERAEQQLVFARTRLEVGTATTSDVLRAELERGNAELAVVEAEATLASASLDLGRIAGQDEPIIPGAGSLPDHAPPLPPADELVQRALWQSPSVLATEAEVDARAADRLASWSTYLPSLRLTGGYDWFAFQFPPDQQSWSLRLIGSFPIFNGFQREATLQRAGVQLRSARARARDAELAVNARVRSALTTITTAERRVAITDRGVTLAREDLRVQEERYQISVATIVELQTSQVALADAEAEAVRARQALGTAVAELEAILGEGIRVP
jgi:outer membrane protein TolC